ncbi:non-specific lipid transfer protein GPI-anchored 6 isoform X2 [Alnus glutinosa]|uniref:non-specific lipid transfer protein GPI-anchored 6 isoform X2 n=1 Tax=Alnus glutinosa TaxID=3517 RepID=UPI002D77B366|nr:non-specific lipid transfer protein GPI-anchored 6 isoform X2 [Alnus glutinosa]
MASNNVTLALMLLIILVGFGSSNLDQDRAECADQLVGLATCLPYVGGEAKAPTLDCCTGLKQVLQKSRKCLCILIKDRDDPNLGLQINATLALGLPSACHAPLNTTECVSLLHLAPNSTDAKVFEGFSNSTKGTSATPVASVKGNSTGSGSSAEEKSDGGMRKRWLGVEMVCGILLWFFTS